MISAFDCQRVSSITTRIKTERRVTKGESTVGQRVSSITTRIKTWVGGLLDVYIDGQRASSITTRIKTYGQCKGSERTAYSQRASSITTRIKTSYRKDLHDYPLEVREHLPLQQGLRHPLFGGCGDNVSVREHLPLQQGLRLGPQHTNSMLLPQSESIFHYNKD